MIDDLRKIVWLTSYPKSGNTWFRIFLANLLEDFSKDVDINQLYTIPVSSSRNLFDNISGISSSNLYPSEIDSIRPRIYENIARESEGLAYLKVHDAWKLSSSGDPIFPENITKIVIYIIRNPLDIAVSYAFHSNESFSSIIKEMNNSNHAYCIRKDQLYHQLEQHISDWSSHVHSWVDNSNLPIIILRYEDMLSNTFREFKKAIMAIGLNKSDLDIRKAIEATRFEILSQQEIMKGFQEKPIKMNTFFRKGTSGNWREHLSNKNVNEIIANHKQLMERFGYLKENKPII